MNLRQSHNFGSWKHGKEGLRSQRQVSQPVVQSSEVFLHPFIFSARLRRPTIMYRKTSRCGKGRRSNSPKIWTSAPNELHPKRIKSNEVSITVERSKADDPFCTSSLFSKSSLKPVCNMFSACLFHFVSRLSTASLMLAVQPAPAANVRYEDLEEWKL